MTMFRCSHQYNSTGEANVNGCWDVETKFSAVVPGHLKCAYKQSKQVIFQCRTEFKACHAHLYSENALVTNAINKTALSTQTYGGEPTRVYALREVRPICNLRIH